MLLSARVLSVEEFFRLGTFTAASVQRDYVWDAQQSEDLLADVERAASAYSSEPAQDSETRISVAGATAEDDDGADEPPPAQAGQDSEPGYHLGSVVLRDVGNGYFEIFDGLQRATTLTILLCVIRDLLPRGALRDRIGALVLTGEATRLSFPGADRTLSVEIQAADQTVRSFRKPVTGRGLRIRRSRAVFHGYLRIWDQDRLARFGDFLLTRTLLVVANTGCQTLARQVFITANNRGVQLRPVDIFKGQLFDMTGSAEALDRASRRWNGILHVTGEGMEDFMRAFDFVKRCEPQGADHLAKLASIIEKNYGASRLDEVLDDILRHASAWVWLMEKLKNAPNTTADLDIWRLRFFKWFEWKPVALAWYHEYSEKRGKAGSAGTKAETMFRQRFEALHRICMMMTLAKFSANDRARIFGKALAQNRNPFSTSAARPGALTFRPQQIARILESLGTPLHDDETRLSLMRWLESMSDGPDLASGAAYASVEHVLPQRPAPDSLWLQDFPDEEERFSACHSIGNLALMDYAENLKITNLDFHLKLPTIKEQSQKYKTLAGIADKTSWKTPEIRERAAKMIDLACRQLNIARPARP